MESVATKESIHRPITFSSSFLFLTIPFFLSFFLAFLLLLRHP